MSLSPAVRDLGGSLGIWFQPDPIIHRVAETLFAAQIPLGCLHGNVPQKELNLLQFTTGLMAKTGASPPKVMGRERRNLTTLCFLLYDTPNDLGAESSAPNPAALVDRPKERTGRNPGGTRPCVNSSLHPVRDRNGANLTFLAMSATLYPRSRRLRTSRMMSRFDAGRRAIFSIKLMRN
jgi:hypothetical protein